MPRRPTSLVSQRSTARPVVRARPVAPAIQRPVQAVQVRASGPRGVRLVVEDDGTGFDPALPPEPGHVGLRGLRDATKEAGGRLEVVSAPGRGTRVELEVAR